MDKIEKIYKTEIEYLKDGIGNIKNLYHTFAFTSVREKFPESRTVVLRDVHVKPFKIFFNSDYRSPKILDLKNNNFCNALFYDKGRKMQLRFKCYATVHHNNKNTKNVWLQTPLQSRKCYMGPFRPSELLEKWDPNIPLEYLKTDPELEHSQDGYKNFAQVELEIIESDILQLNHDGHIRFKVDKDNKFYYIAP